MYKEAQVAYEIDLEVVTGDFLWRLGADTHEAVGRSQTHINFTLF